MVWGKEIEGFGKHWQLREVDRTNHLVTAKLLSVGTTKLKAFLHKIDLREYLHVDVLIFKLEIWGYGSSFAAPAVATVDICLERFSSSA